MGDAQAFEPAPAVAQPVELERAEEGVDLLPADVTAHDHGEQARSAGEIAPPEGVSRVLLQRRVQDVGDLGQALEVVGQRQTVMPVHGQADCHGAQTAQAHVNLVRRDRQPEQIADGLDLAHRFLVADNRPGNNVRVPAHILGRSVGGDIDTVVQRLEVQPRAPGVVYNRTQAPVFGPG